MSRPEKSEYDPFYENYISLAADADIVDLLSSQPDELRQALVGIDEPGGALAYADGKWTIKELLSHVIDGERIFAYRLLRISRGDQTPVEGFDQDLYIEHSHANERTIADLLDEFAELRSANLRQIRNLTHDDQLRTGTANGSSISVRALVRIMAGHVAHHLHVLRSRYLAGNAG
ncbi:MAG: DinB family protein [Pyrinomonadaceae bacterium]